MPGPVRNDLICGLNGFAGSSLLVAAVLGAAKDFVELEIGAYVYVFVTLAASVAYLVKRSSEGHLRNFLRALQWILLVLNSVGALLLAAGIGFFVWLELGGDMHFRF